ncbi:type II toxin-antitoxin system HipA family toxin [Cellvibrio sp. QJXJ]|uniref:type II toxin-antitoxin system HipA family toxin n=1 Tax=Cellvibrio sp. QJXJ TaxID=2964606 RepID=UPI0021C2AC43|nr:type II toxin-antitoxin system HipA family toxin [Cellvibrio sp. QJXJ]UUA75152.1 type II toxin-antitoxin system HipA family toxin [Cellvibrio sp. QJXJ]
MGQQNKMSTIANVYLWGEHVGAVAWNAKDRVADFAYTPEFCKSGLQVSPLIMPLSPTEIYSFPAHRDSNTFKGLPGLLADSLPEKFGNKLLSVWLAKQGRSFNDLNPVERLCYLGARGMGALEFMPDTDGIHSKKDDSMDLDGLLDVARKVMDEHNQVEQLNTDTPNFERLIQIGTSAGGAKAKAVIAWNDSTKEIMSGQGECKAGFEHYLLKLSGVSNDEHESDADTGRMEMAYHLMAVEAGITMMYSRLITDADGVGHFMTRRFDRKDVDMKYHVQTYAAIAHQDRDPVGQCSYEHLFATARELGVGQPSITELFKRMVFNIIARNQDDHTKNHAFMMDGDGQWSITPAYDLCFAYKKNSRFIDSHQMTCNGKRDNFTLYDIVESARAANVKNPKKIISEVNNAIANWHDIAEGVKLPSDKAIAISKMFRNIR